MELPSNIAKLYRHLEKHCAHTPSVPTVSLERTRRDAIDAFIAERMRIWEKKTLGGSEPFTDDTVLANFRFCNIYRELDRQTMIFHELLAPLREDFPLWLLNMFFCRMIARPETIAATGLLEFDERGNTLVLDKLRTLPRPIYGTPYVFPISVIQRSTTPTREEFLTQYLPLKIPAIAKEISGWKGVSVVEGIERILPIFGFRLQFLWTEVLIDVAYQYPERIDLFLPFPIGPGAAPTAACLLPHVRPELLVEALAEEGATTTLTCNGKSIPLSAENWEGIFCEYRKYKNLSEGHGRKRKYGAK